MDQAHCVFDNDAKSMVNFVGTSETLQKDWERVIDAINSRAGTAFQPGILEDANTRVAHTGQGPQVSETKRECSMAKYPHLDAASQRAIGLQYAPRTTCWLRRPRAAARRRACRHARSREQAARA